MMGSAGCSQSNVGNPIQNFELQIQQNDPELGVRQDNRSCATKAFKWIVRHPFLAAAATIGLVGIASGGIFGLTLLGAAAPVATALSGLNASTEAPTTKASTFIARSVTCEKNSRVDPICCDDTGTRPVWEGWSDGRHREGRVRWACDIYSSEESTNNSPYFVNDVHYSDSMDKFCESKGWGKAIYKT